jgi:hypothetical protein
LDIAIWLDRQPALSIWTTAITVMEIRYGLAVMIAADGEPPALKH